MVYPVKIMARVLEVSRSGCYRCLTRGPSRRDLRDIVLKVLIEPAHKRSRGTYGPRRLKDELAAANQQVGRDQISRLRKEMGLKCIQKRKFRITTDSKHHLPVVVNLLEQTQVARSSGTPWAAE